VPIIQQLVDLDKLYQNLPQPPIIINDLPNSTTEDRDHIKRLVYTRYSGDMVSLLPSCRCGATKGEFTRNVICDRCDTPVVSTIENSIEPIIWFRKPEGVEKILSPIVWIMLENEFKKSGFSILQWLTDTSYSPQIKKPPVLAKIIAAGVGRGYNNFVHNFWDIMSVLFGLNEFRKTRNQTNYLLKFLEDNKDILFSDNIPLVNKSLLVVEKTPVGVFVDLATVPLAIEAIEMLVSIDRDFYDQSSQVKQNRTARAMYVLSCGFYYNHFKKHISGKPGMLRRNVGGAKVDYSARAVISSVTDAHRYDELLVPWGVGVVIFRPMLINKLMTKSGLELNSAIGLLMGHVHHFHPLIDKYLKEIISEAPGGRYPIIFIRFPSLLQGSIQQMFIPYIKTDPTDKTFGTPILVTTAPNADFDGDQMVISLCLDKKMADRWYALAPKFNIWDMKKPFGITKNIQLPKPFIATTGMWLAEEED